MGGVVPTYAAVDKRLSANMATPFTEHVERPVHAGGPPSGRSAERPRAPRIHLILFATTLFTTTLAGSLQRGANPLSSPSELLLGLPFAVPLMLILLSHEMGHYVLARVHGVWTSLPYFIPGPPFFVGTFGAFIRLKSFPSNRRALFDIGAAGPWAGLVLAVPAAAVGLALSEVRPLDPFAGGIILGDSFLFSGLTWLILGVGSDDVSIVLHPVALAGWFGLFVTFLNLLPVGQLDGGHVVYSLFGALHRWIARVCLVGIVALGFLGWQGWFVWVVLLAVLGVDHPPTADRGTALDGRRRLCAWCTIALFVLTFTAVPLSVQSGRGQPDPDAVPVAYSAVRHTAPSGWTFVYRP